jgi:hypothetical protein
MNTCSYCGTLVDEKYKHCSRCEALQVLELAVDATENDIRSARRMLVKVWEPGRFEDDPKLKESAETKLKDINSAFEFLTSTSMERSPDQRPKYANSYKASQGASANPQTTATVEPAKRSAFGKIAHAILSWLWPTIKISCAVATFAFVVLLGRYLWIAFDAPEPTSAAVTTGYGDSQNGGVKWLEAPKIRFLEAVQEDLRRLGLQNPAPIQKTEPTAQKANNQHPDKAHGAPRKVLPYITIGSTKEDVVAQQGSPTESSEDKLVYGKSELYLKDGSVIGWRIDAAASPIRVKLWPGAAVDPTLTSFTVGSSKDVVLVVQGTPTAFTDDSFEYGGSEVSFHNNKVISWKNDPASVPLRAQ